MLIEIDYTTLKKILSKGEIIFEYEKKDGTLRKSRGTTLFDIIPDQHLPKQKEDSKNKSMCSYFDTDINEWRSVAKERKIYLETSSFSSIDKDFLDDFEIKVILWDQGKLEDKENKELIDFIMSCLDNKENVNNILEKNEKLIFTCWNYMEDHEYKNKLINKWNNFNNS